MKKFLLLLTSILIIMPMNIFGQSYSSLWKQVEKASDDDLPQQEQKLLQKIIDRATRDKEYGQLLKAQLRQLTVANDVSNDSLRPAVERLEAEADATTDAALRAVRYAALGIIYRENDELDDHADRRSEEFFDKALEQPAPLAKAKALAYKPLVEEGSDSRLFDNDLLSVIGYEAKRYATLHRYYLTTNNRRAQLLTGLEMLRYDNENEMERYYTEPLQKSEYLHRLDSLIDKYGDLRECGEVAIERMKYMDNHTDATAEQVWQYINVALDRWGAWPRMNIMRNKQRQLSVVQFEASLPDEVALPRREQKVELDNLRGVRGVTMRVYRVDAKGDIDINPGNSEDYTRLKPLLRPLDELTQTRTYMGHQPYDLYEDTLTLPGLEPGVYMVEFESDPATDLSRRLLFVSDVRAITLPLPGDKLTRVVAVNATTGQPLPGATVQFIVEKRERQKNGKYVTHRDVKTQKADQNGELVTNDLDYRTRVYVTTDTDPYCPLMNGLSGTYFLYEGRRQQPFYTNIFTDRAIYRPGQTVHAAAIVYTNKNGFENDAFAGKTVEMVLRDVNNREVAKEEVMTDEYGTCAADFLLPTNGLTGEFCIVANNTRHYFRVEEYKRPTFDLEFPTVNESYEDGDTVVVRPTAMTYAGVPVQGAKVKWNVTRRRAFWWWSYSRYWQQGAFGTGSDDVEMASGETVTEADGTFAAEMPMVLPQTKHPMFYSFVLHVSVTDQAGETHEGEMSLPLGNRRTALSCNVPDKILAEAMPPVTIRLLNAAGADVAGKVRYQIDGGEWTEVDSNTPFTLPRLNSGRHILRAESPGNCDEPIEETFVLFSEDDSLLPVETDDWFWQSAPQFANDGRPVTIQVGASGSDIHILYAIFSGDRQIESGYVNKSDELLNRKFTYDDSYRNGLLLTFAWMRDGEAHRHSTTIRRPLPDKRLKLEWATFRDRLTPGQKEEWTLTVRQPDGKPAPAQLMATLYDKSLDQLAAHSLSFSPLMYVSLPSVNWQSVNWGRLRFDGSKEQDRLTVADLDFNHFDDDVFPTFYFYRNSRGAMLGGAMPMRHVMYRKAAMNDDMMADEAPVLYSMALKESVEEEEAIGNADDQNADQNAGEGSGEGGSQGAPSVRENLQETAFFMPQLVADKTGTVQLKFTLPESLTTWRFLGLAHTADMMVGTLEGESVARKDVMIQPNMPRFLRMGDEGMIAAKVMNTSDKPVSGKARLQLLHPETLQEVTAVSEKTLTVGAGQTASVAFACRPASEWPSLLVARITIEGTGFSDGEQHYLPVLPNSERVTVSVPFTQNGPGTKTVDLAAMLPQNGRMPDQQPSNYTFEYTNNPAWLLIQALPSVAHAYDHCAVCQATSLYANMIGRHILSQNPTAQHVFEQWSRETGQETSLMSSLEKNQELRELVLDETPWVADADNETKQKHILGDFFNNDLINQRIDIAVKNLQMLQDANGGWSWWPGMKPSLYMTTEVAELLVRLNKMVAHSSETGQMLDKAFGYLGDETVELVREMKKDEKKGVKPTFPSHRALEWLYLCAVDGRELPRSVREANDYLIALLPDEIKRQSIREKALTAIILSNKTYVQSLKEWTVYREDMGRYYDTPRALYSWRDYRIPTQVAAIEALQQLTPEDTVTIQEMQRWLLQQKRTQSWDTPINSADAIYAFLNNNSQALAPQEATDLRVDGQALPCSEATAGIGYVKTTLPIANQKEFTARKTSTGTSWGAVYAQFMQTTSDITAQQSGISVKRELMVADGSPYIKIGTRVKVRITIEADRDYDFVQVIDKRAACMEPVEQLSGYRWGWGCYCAPRDNATCFYFDLLAKGKHVIETEYYADRAGTYQTGTCTAECAYSPEFRGKAPSLTVTVKDE